MPVVIQKKAFVPEWVDDPSVFDSPYKQAARTVIKTLGLDDPTNSLPAPEAMGSVMGDVLEPVISKIAPKRAASELADLLMGRSKRVPPMVKPLTDEEAKWSALLQSRNYTRPAPPTEIEVGKNSGSMFQQQTRRLPREDGITAAFRTNQKLADANPNYIKVVVGDSKYTNQPMVPSPQAIRYNNSKDLVKDIGTLHTAASKGGFKVYTENEIKNMMEGPRRAFKEGLIDNDELTRRLAENQAKIDASKRSIGLAAATAQSDAATKRIAARTQGLETGK